MAEALAAVGLASAIVQFIEFGTKVVTRLSEFSAEVDEVPKTFRSIKVQLPLSLNILQQTKDQADTRQVDEDTARALEAVVGECTATVQQLDERLNKALPDDKASRRDTTLVISKDLSSGRAAENSYTTLPQPKLKPCFMVQFEQDPNFVGREDELREIEERFKAQHRVVLAGIGGVGKSQIAIEYCYRFRNKHKDAHVFWIHGSGHTRFEESYQSIAQQLALPRLDDPNQPTLVHVRDWLSQESNCPWLLVLDNMDDVDVIFRPENHSCSGSQKHTHEPLVNWLPRSSVGSVLITTRDRRLGDRLVPGQRPIAVDLFEMKDAKCLLSKRVQLEGEIDEALSHQLLSILDFLPLAITQATAFLVENQISIADYLEILQKDDSEMKEFLAIDIYDPGRDSDLSNSILQTWKVSFDQIRKQKPLAADILSLMAVLDRQAISDRLLCQGKDIGIDFKSAMGVLKAFSMIKSESGDKVFSTHRLVQLATQRWLELEGEIDKWQEVALKSVCCCIPQSLFNREWREWETMSPHVIRVLQNDTGKSKIRTRDHLTKRAWLLLKQGDYICVQTGRNAALPFLAESLKLTQHLFGTDSAIVLQSMTKMADALEANVAADIYRDVLRKCENKTDIADYHHVQTICLAALAECTMMQGERDYKEAEKIYRKLYKNGPPYKGATCLYFNHGSSLLECVWKQGDQRKDEAEEIHKELISGLTDFHWKDAIFISAGLMRHVIYLQGTGRCDEAKIICERLLEALKPIVGENHKRYKNVLRFYGKNLLAP